MPTSATPAYLQQQLQLRLTLWLLKELWPPLSLLEWQLCWERWLEPCLGAPQRVLQQKEQLVLGEQKPPAQLSDRDGERGGREKGRKGGRGKERERKRKREEVGRKRERESIYKHPHWESRYLTCFCFSSSSSCMSFSLFLSSSSLVLLSTFSPLVSATIISTSST